MFNMNKLDVAKRAQILAMLCEGSSMRSISRLADVSINTVSKLLVDAGRFCAGFHDAKVRDVKAKRVQVDEIWSFVGAKAKNVPNMKAPMDGAGDVWTWTAIEADTKLIVSHFVGGRDGQCALWFMDDLRARLANRVQLTSDGPKAYLEAVEGAFGGDVDYAMLVKIYGTAPESARGRYSPAECIGAKPHRVDGFSGHLMHRVAGDVEDGQLVADLLDPEIVTQSKARRDCPSESETLQPFVGSHCSA